jgi:hypothetical protein
MVAETRDRDDRNIRRLSRLADRFCALLRRSNTK